MKYTKSFFNLVSILIIFTILIYLFLARWVRYSHVLKIESIDKDEYINKTSQWPFGSFSIASSNHCKSIDKVEVIILVHSAITHFENRAIIRSYVPSEHIKIVFLIGTPLDPSLQSSLLEENERYGDMVQGTFYDTYHNLTLKHIMALTWTLKYCSQATFVIKADDDIFINYYLLFNYLDENFPKLSTDPMISRTGYQLFACYIQKNVKVIRDKKNKWYVSPTTYPQLFYPQFCSGWAYLTTPETINSVLNMVSSVPLFWIDDVFVTGILRSKRKDIFLEEMNKWFNTNAEYLYQWITDVNRPFKWRYIFSNTNGDVGLLRSALEQNAQCFKNRAICRCCFPSFKSLFKKLNSLTINSTAKVSLMWMG